MFVFYQHCHFEEYKPVVLDNVPRYPFVSSFFQFLVLFLNDRTLIMQGDFIVIISYMCMVYLEQVHPLRDISIPPSQYLMSFIMLSSHVYMQITFILFIPHDSFFSLSLPCFFIIFTSCILV
jgi:hypothetical protein